MKDYIYVVDFDVPYDDWETVLVTTNVNNAINKIRNSCANSIKVWKNEKLIDEFYFYKDIYDSEEYFIADMKYFTGWLKKEGIL